MSDSLDDIGLQARVLGALQTHPQVRDAFRRRHLPVAGLFDGAVMRELARAALAGQPPRLQPESAREMQFHLAVARIYTPADPAWGIDLLHLLIGARCERALPPTLRWAADALEHRWMAPARVRRIVAEALDACDDPGGRAAGAGSEPDDGRGRTERRCGAYAVATGHAMEHAAGVGAGRKGAAAAKRRAGRPGPRGPRETSRPAW
jgi:hypothetical protein